MIIGLTGSPPAGSGKDTLADYLVLEYNMTKVALADPMKRFCADIFDWPPEVLWGESNLRGIPDKRYPRKFARTTGEDDSFNHDFPVEFLTPRYALQRLGSEFGRDCYTNVWVNYCLRICRLLLEGQPLTHVRDFTYTQAYGLRQLQSGMTVNFKGVVIPDVRFDNEAAAIQKAGGKIWCIERPGAGLKGDASKHSSEVGVSHCLIDEYIINNSTIEFMYNKVQTLMRMKEYAL